MTDEDELVVRDFLVKALKEGEDSYFDLIIYSLEIVLDFDSAAVFKRNQPSSFNGIRHYRHFSSNTSSSDHDFLVSIAPEDTYIEIVKADRFRGNKAPVSFEVLLTAFVVDHKVLLAVAKSSDVFEIFGQAS